MFVANGDHDYDETKTRTLEPIIGLLAFGSFYALYQLARHVFRRTYYSLPWPTLTVPAVAIIVSLTVFPRRQIANGEQWYQEFVTSIAKNGFGIWLSEMNFANQTEYLLTGTIIMVAYFALLHYVIRYMFRYHITGFLMFFVAIYLYVFPFPFAAPDSHTGTTFATRTYWFDPVRQQVYLRPSAILKVLFAMMLIFHLATILFSMVAWMFRISIRIIWVIGIILLTITLIAPFLAETQMKDLFQNQV